MAWWFWLIIGITIGFTVTTVGFTLAWAVTIRKFLIKREDKFLMAEKRVEALRSRIEKQSNRWKN